MQSIGDGVDSTNELMDKVRRKEFKKRRVSVVPVTDVPGCTGCRSRALAAVRQAAVVVAVVVVVVAVVLA